MARRSRNRSPALIFLASGDTVILIACTVLAMCCRWPLWLAYLIGINLATFLAYAYDKFAAGAQWSRTPEQVLHLFAIVGGSPAALLGQRLFRHKTIKRSFRMWFWIILTAQVMAVCGLVFLTIRGPR